MTHVAECGSSVKQQWPFNLFFANLLFVSLPLFVSILLCPFKLQQWPQHQAQQPQLTWQASTSTNCDVQLDPATWPDPSAIEAMKAATAVS